MPRTRKIHGPIAKTTLYLPEPFMVRLKHLAIDRRCTVTDLITEAVEHWLRQVEKTSKKATVKS